VVLTALSLISDQVFYSFLRRRAPVARLSKSSRKRAFLTLEKKKVKKSSPSPLGGVPLSLLFLSTTLLYSCTLLGSAFTPHSLQIRQTSSLNFDFLLHLSLERLSLLTPPFPSFSPSSFYFRPLPSRSFFNMSRSLTLVTLLALTSTSVFASNEIVEADQSPAPFQLNLARTFSSTIDQLKKRDGFKATVPKVSRAKERSISDDLVALLKRTFLSSFASQYKLLGLTLFYPP